ncbi:unnamed protein product [Polarella glacialis]|uniref:Glucosamine 6-phosphate N-acetyltransferase n=1 Tax=Polarella glacialis TaxID=89957 RepID=A0A813EY13_POLGL|nr:unnamed protein product [Polarella glacialis]
MLSFGNWTLSRPMPAQESNFQVAGFGKAQVKKSDIRLDADSDSTKKAMDTISRRGACVTSIASSSAASLEIEVRPQGLCEGYNVRRLHRDDYHKGLGALLSQLTVGDLAEERFLEMFHLRESQAGVYHTFVIEHLETHRLVATATLIVEAKFVHGGSFVGHIEDVVVDDSHRRKGLAKSLMDAVAHEAQRLKCYKVILDCNETNVPVYEKCGYRVGERQMRLDIPPETSASGS